MTVPPLPTDFSLARPKAFWAGGVDASTNFLANTFPGQGRCWLIQGIDAYPNVQPNNGDFVVQVEGVGIVGQHTLFQVQQSANFPGPFFWRGCVPMFFGNNLLEVTATVSFDFFIWGTETVDFTLDLNEPFP